MPDVDIERLIVDLDANLRSYARKMDQEVQTTDRRVRKIEQRFETMNRNIARSMDGVANDLRRAIATLAVGLVGREALQAADSWSRYENQLLAAGIAQGDLNATMQENVEIAKATRSGLEGTVNLYTRLLRSTQQLGLSQTQVARATELVNKAFVAGGAGASERAAATLQLSQGLASGLLQGDELRSIRENAPLLAQAIADEFGTTIGELKQLGADGEITTDRLVRAILNGGEAIERQFRSTRRTVSDAFTNLRTETTRYIASFDDAVGISDKLAAAIDAVTNNVELFGDACIIVATTVGGVLAGRAMAALITSMVSAGTAIGATTLAMNGLRGAMAFFGGPVGALITAMAVALGALVAETRRAEERMKAFDETMQGLSSTLEDTEQFLDDNAESLRDIGAAARDARNEIADMSTALDELPANADPMMRRLAATMETVVSKGAAQGALDELRAERERQQIALERLLIESGGIRASELDANGRVTSPAIQALDRRIAEAEALIAVSQQRLEDLADAPDANFAPAPPTPATPAAVRDAEINRLEAEDALRRGQGLDTLHDGRLLELRGRKSMEDAGFSAEEIDRIMRETRLAAAARRNADFAEGFFDNIDAALDAQDRATYDESLFEADLERLRGNDQAAQRLEREAYMAARRAELRSRGVGGDEASATAADEARQIDEARLAGQVRDAFTTGARAALEGDFEDFLKDRVANAFGAGIDAVLGQIATNLMNIIGNAIGGGGGGAGFWSAAFSAMGFAEGGSFKVGGAGGTDSQFVPLALTPGETVDIRRPGQSGATVVQVAFHGARMDSDARVEQFASALAAKIDAVSRSIEPRAVSAVQRRVARSGRV